MEMVDLVKLAKNGDKKAFASLYEQVYTDLYRFAYCMLSQPQDAEDAVSETVIDAYRGISKLKDNSSFRNWMFKILSVKCKRKMSEYYEAKVPLDEVEDYLADIKDDINLLNFKLALNELEFDERCIVTYSVVGEYNSREIAEILDLNRNTVRSKLSRALEKVRKKMEAKYEW